MSEIDTSTKAVAKLVVELDNGCNSVPWQFAKLGAETLESLVRERDNLVAKLEAEVKTIEGWQRRYDEKQLDCSELRQQLASAQAEILRIKHGIKTTEGTMIVDGKDMYDWGWFKAYDYNKELPIRPLSIFGSCTCLTKTPDIKFHKVDCRYRLIVENEQLRKERDYYKAEYTQIYNEKADKLRAETPEDIGEKYYG